MEKYRIKYLPDTVADRAAIKLYLSQYYVSTVRKFFTLLKERIAQLKMYPYACPVYEDDPAYRVLVVEDYLVFFMIDEVERIVEIHRIFHSSRNIQQWL